MRYLSIIYGIGFFINLLSFSYGENFGIPPFDDMPIIEEEGGSPYEKGGSPDALPFGLFPQPGESPSLNDDLITDIGEGIIEV